MGQVVLLYQATPKSQWLTITKDYFLSILHVSHMLVLEWGVIYISIMPPVTHKIKLNRWALAMTRVTSMHVSLAQASCVSAPNSNSRGHSFFQHAQKWRKTGCWWVRMSAIVYTPVSYCYHYFCCYPYQYRFLRIKPHIFTITQQRTSFS